MIMKAKDNIQNSLVRVIPHNIMAEQMLLGAILTNNEAIHKVNDFLLAEYFYEPIHQLIY